MIRAAIAYGTFPALLAGATAGGWLLIVQTRPDLAVAATGLACVLAVATLERVSAYVPAYNTSHGDVQTDILHNIVSSIAIPEVMRLLCFAGLYRVSAMLSARLGFELWPSAWPILAQLGLALVVAELPSYAFHRVQHRSELWWRIHATHHSVPRLYWLNAGRFHPLDGLLSYALLVLPLVLLGVPEDTLALFTVFVTAHGLLQHSNIDLRHGGLSWVFSTAELHRWHHAPDPVDGNHNYGAVLAIWDVIFGTRYLPRDRKPPLNIGIGNMPEFPTGYLAQVASPFTWNDIGGRGPIG